MDPFSRIAQALREWFDEHFHVRTSIGLLLFFTAFAMCLQALVLGEDQSGLLLNFGTELLGMLLTLVFIERLLEARKLRDNAKRLALEFLQDIDHVVWVWQGGRREFSTSELEALLIEAHSDDPIAPCTAHLLMDLGDRAARARRVELEAVRCNPGLFRALSLLEFFVQMRDLGNSLSGVMIKQQLYRAAHALAHACEARRFASVADLPPGPQNSAPREQERRYAGGYLEQLEVKRIPRPVSYEG